MLYLEIAPPAYAAVSSGAVKCREQVRQTYSAQRVGPLANYYDINYIKTLCL